MLARLLALALVLSVCVHLANDVLDPLLELEHHAPALVDGCDGRSAHLEPSEAHFADASISSAPDPAPGRVAKDSIASGLNPAPPRLLARDFFRPPLSPRLS